MTDMTNKMVKVQCMVDAQVVIKKPEFGVNRRWAKRGQVQGIPYDILEQILWDNGVKHMFDAGILYIDDMEVKKNLGLEPYDAEEPENIIVLNENEMKMLWRDASVDDFKREVSRLSRVQVDNLISYAVETEMVDAQKCRFIKDITKKDVLKAIARKQEMEEIDAKEAAKAELHKNSDGRHI